VEALVRLVVWDFYGCDTRTLNDKKKLESVMLRAAKLIGASVIGSSFTSFNPAGVSGVVTIAESHLAIHTWPEYRFAAVTFETCGNRIMPWNAFRYLKRALRAQKTSQFDMHRGIFDVAPGSLPHKPGSRR
jgi:S-adenosylmethionine decarboxylase proenzyme